MKIDKVWTQMFGTSLIRRKSDAEHDSPEKRKNHQQYQQDSQNYHQQKDGQASKEEVEKAVAVLKASAEFSSSGLLLNLVETPDKTLTVEIQQPNGTVVKSMTGAEFLRLRSLSDGETIARGKILDQKF